MYVILLDPNKYKDYRDSGVFLLFRRVRGIFWKLFHNPRT